MSDDAYDAQLTLIRATLAAMTPEQRAKALRDVTQDICGPWDEDGCYPANYVRNDGLGNEVAKVDRWCGHYQSPHEPAFVGWRATKGSSSDSGIIRVDGDVEEAIVRAKHQADMALLHLTHDRWPEDPVTADDVRYTGRLGLRRKHLDERKARAEAQPAPPKPDDDLAAFDVEDIQEGS